MLFTTEKVRQFGQTAFEGLQRVGLRPVKMTRGTGPIGMLEHGCWVFSMVRLGGSLSNMMWLSQGHGCVLAHERVYLALVRAKFGTWDHPEPSTGSCVQGLGDQLCPWLCGCYRQNEQIDLPPIH